MSVSIFGISATRGTLLALRQQLGFIKKGKEILEMKRDRLAGEINKLLSQINIRMEVDEKFNNVYRHFLDVLIRRGFEQIKSISNSISNIKIDIKKYSVMGVEVVKLSIVDEPNINAIPDPLIQSFVSQLYEAFKLLLKSTEIEVNTEAIALELMSTSRKVNSLEKIVIPMYEELIHYVEERLLEEAIEEFSRTKYIAERRGRE